MLTAVKSNKFGPLRLRSLTFYHNRGLQLNTLDRVEPSLTETITENGVINVIRVEKVTDVVEEPVQFAVVTKKDESLEKGKEKILTEGKQGRISKQFEVLIGKWQRSF